MPMRIETITMDCWDERRLSAFWTSALGHEVAVDQPGDWIVLQDPSGAGPSIGLQMVPEPKVVKNRVHLDLIPTEGELETEIRRLRPRQ
ncbi:MAG: glyoxalase/bleomycin resistance protein/dioxygenase [Thermomicrobiales bacterium]|nr:glyoxalase/bleomycin resistance protein/dioxygenase [Thermomicrobiales bacterium]